MRQLTQENLQDDYDPQVNLEVEGFMIPQVVVNFGSQVNILPKETWIKMGKPKLTRSKNFLKLAYQQFVEPIDLLRSVKTLSWGYQHWSI
jgi:hypothetical protein